MLFIWLQLVRELNLSPEHMLLVLICVLAEQLVHVLADAVHWDELTGTPAMISGWNTSTSGLENYSS